MDGFALLSADLPGKLAVTQTIAAGAMPTRPIASGECARIMTGAPLPAGADAVVMREDVEDRQDVAVFKSSASQGQHIRKAGEDINVGESYLQQGQQVGHGELALLAAQVEDGAWVYRRPRVAVLSTGDELVPPGRTPGPGQIVNSNNLVLCAQVRAAGGIAYDAGIVPDQRQATERALRALSDYDVLLTSGGVSVGDFDYVKDAFQTVGIGIDFWKVAIKPGKPLAFGRRDGQLVFGLPGNPASSLVSFELFVRPALRALLGDPKPLRRTTRARLGDAISKKPGRAYYIRASLEERDGELWALPASTQSSGALRSMTALDGLIILPADSSDAEQGQQVSVLPVDAPFPRVL
jgi:molybdopterin molybdotransferase